MKYGTLEVEVRKHLVANGKANQVSKLSSLSQLFQKALKRNEEDLVEQDLAPDYQEASEKQFVDHMQKMGMTKSTISTNLSFIRTNFFNLYQNSFSVLAIISSRPLGAAIKDLRALRSLTRPELCKILKEKYAFELGVQTLALYEAGKNFPRSSDAILKIELALGAPAGSLKVKVPSLELSIVDFKCESPLSPELKKHWSYGYKPDPTNPAPIDKDIEHLIWFKGASHSELGEYELLRGDRAALNSEVSIENTRGKYYRYIAYLLMPVYGSHPLCSGKGYSREKLRLPDLLRSSNLDGYIDFLKLRAAHAGKPVETPKWFIEIYKCIRDISADDGVLTQTRARYLKHEGYLSEYVHSQEAWRTKLKKIYDSTGNDMKAFIAKNCSSEADLDAIADVTKLDRPIRALVNVVNGMSTDISIYGPLGKPFERDYHYLMLFRAFFAFEARFPLRISHLNDCVLVDDLVFRGEPGKENPEAIFLRKSDFKNDYSPATKDGEFDLVFPASQDLKIDVPKVIGEYIRLSRPFFLKRATKRIQKLKSLAEEFSKKGDQKTANECLAEAESIPKRLFPIELSERRHYMYSLIYSKTDIGWSFHDNRHIVATDKVKFFFKHGHDGFVFAAAALFDTVDTVKDIYAQFDNGDVHKLALSLESEIAQRTLPSIERKESEKNIMSDFEVTKAVNDYVNREKEILLSMTDSELADTFADPAILKRVKARLKAIMRTQLDDTSKVS